MSITFKYFLSRLLRRPSVLQHHCRVYTNAIVVAGFAVGQIPSFGKQNILRHTLGSVRGISQGSDKMSAFGEGSSDGAHMALEDKFSSRGGRRGGRSGGRGGRGGGGGGGLGREVLISKAMSTLLRHKAGEAGISLDEEGFAPLDKVVSIISGFPCWFTVVGLLADPVM